MMNLDRFFDTKTKRQHAFHLFFLLLSCWIIITYLLCAFSLIGIDSYDAMFAKLTNNGFDSCYISRVVLRCMSMIQFDVIKIIENLCLSLRIEDLSFLIMLLIICFDSSFQRIRKQYFIIPIVFLIQTVIIGAIAILATTATSFMSVIGYVQIIGWVMLIGQILLSMFVMRFIIKEYLGYKEAMQYIAIEVEDN